MIWDIPGKIEKSIFKLVVFVCSLICKFQEISGKDMDAIDIIGSTGVFMILLAYFLLVSHKLSRDSLLYLGMNALGAGLACLASILLHYWPFIILEAAWTLVSLSAIINLKLIVRGKTKSRN